MKGKNAAHLSAHLFTNTMSDSTKRFATYKSNTQNSKRTQAFSDDIVDDDQMYNRKKKTNKRRKYNKKKKFLDSFKVIEPHETYYNKLKIVENKPVFFSGKETTDINNHEPIPNEVVYSAPFNCRVIDDKPHNFSGLIGKDGEDNIVFIKIPRDTAINDHQIPPAKDVYEYIESFIKKHPTKVRGNQRVWRGDAYNYDGITAGQGKAGLFRPKFLGNPGDHANSEMKRVEEIVKNHLPLNDKDGFNNAKWKIEHMNHLLPDEKIFTALAAGKNVYLRQHTDSDSFYSAVFVHSYNPEFAKKKSKRYKRNLPVACYFVFGKLGYSVALRPGDILIFHPLETHSVSSRTEFFEKQSIDIIVSSLYLKTAVVGGNVANGKVHFNERTTKK